MSFALYNRQSAGLRFWTQEEILIREQAIARLLEAVSRPLLDLNSAWRFERVETPVMMPREDFSCAYDSSDIFELAGVVGDKPFALRAETTPGTYLIAEHLLKSTKMRGPICFWQAGPSFRRESSDGATSEKLRFNQFWQLEFQCLYPEDSKADYATPVRESVRVAVEKLVGTDARLIESDRLPAYATETIDIEAIWKGDWKEVASTSKRTDFPEINGAKKLTCFEVALGLDRLVAITNQEA
ncbi:hypothetical protein CcrC1_gp224c [Caulobacter phage C1]|nr:hypothetical protein CcrC1_gp224c [Caulobacter phage C1]UTU08453.1 hypothetical protein CcrC2_gp225c [Caulobacter phage C2]UTU08970.1 hypothetical protein CcrJ4_gp219c [Caulobacter phage J4]UTU10086.1 hypothetical protein CcrRB23_gp224c [Caulobacter phage RB23]WGN97121.1 hypothetical protein [Bertelyvirus sp.]